MKQRKKVRMSKPRAQPTKPDYKLNVRQVSMQSDEDWDAVAQHAAIEFGQKMGPRRGRGVDDLHVTIRDIVPPLTKLFDRLGCCGQTPKRILHRENTRCHPQTTVLLEGNSLLQNGAFPSTVLLEQGLTGQGIDGVGALHGVDQFGGYRYSGQVNDNIRTKFEGYESWQHPIRSADPQTKVILPNFEQSFAARRLNKMPKSKKQHLQSTNNDYFADEFPDGRLPVPDFPTTKDGVYGTVMG